MAPRTLLAAAVAAVFLLSAFSVFSPDGPEQVSPVIESSSAAPMEWNIDQTHSSVGFRVRHLGISKVRGSFTDYEATMSFDPEDLSTLETSVTIQVQSIDTGVERRDNHLRSADFFTVEEFPTMTFVSKEVRNIDGDTFELVGDLTLKDVTKEVVLEAEFLGMAATQRGAKAGFEARTTIDRFDYNLKWDRITEAGGLVVSREVEIILELELNEQAS